MADRAPRGRISEPSPRVSEPEQPKPRKRVEHRAYTYSLGSGPPCPDGGPEKSHGHLYDWRDGRWYCSHEAHGGNGKFFTDEEVRR